MMETGQWGQRGRMQAKVAEVQKLWGEEASIRDGWKEQRQRQLEKDDDPQAAEFQATRQVHV